MPLWPLPPVLAIVGIGLTLRYQKFGDIITPITIAIGVILLARLPQPPHQARAEPGVKPSMIAAERMRHPTTPTGKAT
jgi:hypothetical protein